MTHGNTYVVALVAALVAAGCGVIRDSVLSNNPSRGFETQGYPGIFVLAAGDPQVSGSTLE